MNKLMNIIAGPHILFVGSSGRTYAAITVEAAIGQPVDPMWPTKPIGTLTLKKLQLDACAWKLGLTDSELIAIIRECDIIEGTMPGNINV